MNQNTQPIIPFLSEIENAKGLLSGILDTSPNAPAVINDLILIFESLASKENPADTWVFAEELQMFLYSKSDDCRDCLIDYKAKLKAEGGESVSISKATDDFDDSTLSEASADTLALALSEVLRNENLPESVYNAVQTGLNDVYNDFDESTVNEFESSPEYIAFVLNAAKNAEGAE